MAVSLESSNKVWQKVKGALNGAGVSRSSAIASEAFLQLKIYLASQKKNPDLQFIPFSAADIDTGADGLVALSGAGKLYAVYAKRVADVDTTDSFLEVLDDATDNSAPTTDIVATLRFSGASSEEAFVVFPEGHILGTGLVVSSTTTAGGTTESAATESADGFLIVGAAYHVSTGHIAGAS